MPDDDKDKKHTKVRDKSPLDFTVGDAPNNPIATRPEEPQSKTSEPVKAPELKKSNKRVDSLTPTDQVRDYMNRIRDVSDETGEMSNADAARRAGLTHGVNEPVISDNVPAIINRLPANIRSDLADVSKGVQTTSKIIPEWHTIATLPAYMSRAIRAMGRGAFSMFTHTPLEEIVTIANLNGQGPNSAAELNAVGNWLMKNATDLGKVDMDYSQMIPGYNPEIKEYQTGNTRFHVVRDPMGTYIYAYPEQDAVNNTAQHGIEDHTDDERDEYGALIKKLKEETDMTQRQSISEQIRHYTEILENLQEEALYESQFQELIEMIINESTLGGLINRTPGGPSLVRYLHHNHKLGNDANYEEAPMDERTNARDIKASKDNFVIVVGDTGVAGIKPLESDWDEKFKKKGAEVAKSNSLRYVVVWATGDHPAEQEIRKYRLGTNDGNGGLSGRENQAPNLFMVLKDRIGRAKHIYFARGAVERDKIAKRDTYKDNSMVSLRFQQQPIKAFTPAKTTNADGEQGIVPNVQAIENKFRPIFVKMLQQATGNIQDKVQRFVQAGNYDGVSKYGKAGHAIQGLLTALNTTTPNWEGPELKKFTYLVQHAINSIPGESKEEFLRNIIMGRTKELGDLLHAVRDSLYDPDKWNRNY